jgi:2-methylisocitrate lyase-like PEP mutase family enzyme
VRTERTWSYRFACEQCGVLTDPDVHVPPVPSGNAPHGGEGSHTMNAALMTAQFHALHHAGAPLLLPNAWDRASAAALAAAGFTAIGTTSLGVAAAHGLPDGRGVARDETLALARALTGLAVPFTVDIEAGFSEDPGEVAELAVALHEAGASGVNLEDGRSERFLADARHQAELITAVKLAVPALFLNARTDPFWLGLDDPLPAALDRAEHYLAAGADGIFVPGVATDEDISSLANRVQAPLNTLYLPGRHTVGRLAELGVQRVSTGSLLFRTAVHAAVETARTIRDGESVTTDALSYAQIQGLVTGRAE